MNKNEKQSKSLKSSVLSRIESDQVCPKSRLFFQSRECSVWFLWLLSVIFGAFAVAVTLYVLMNNQYSLYEATHDNFFTFLVEVLPFLWVGIFGLMTFVAIYNLRHTSRGYRYPVSVILASSLVLSLAGGSALQLFGLGYTIDHMLGKSMKMYVSQEKLEERVWQMPEDGRLIGNQVFATLSPTSTIIFEDVTGQRWQVMIDELEAYDIELLAKEGKIKLLGKVLDENIYKFHACGAFPQMVGEDMNMNKMSQERQRFVDRVYKLADKAKKPPAFDEGNAWSALNLPPDSVCSHIKPVRNMAI